MYSIDNSGEMSGIFFAISRGSEVRFVIFEKNFRSIELFVSPQAAGRLNGQAEWCANKFATAASPKFSASTQALGSATLSIDLNIAHFGSKIDYSA